MITLDDLMQMNRHQLQAVMERGHPLDLDELAESQYLGVDLSLPPLMHKLLWKTFRKTFHEHGAGGLRGWNVRMKQTGVDGPAIPLTDKRGQPITFGHYRVRSAEGIRFPKGWRGANYLDYGTAGNKRLDPARLGYTPLVAVNAGSMELLLGWEVFKVGKAFLPLPDYWALKRQGPLDEVVPIPSAN